MNRTVGSAPCGCLAIPVRPSAGSPHLESAVNLENAQICFNQI